MTLSPQTLTNKCAELAQRLGWASGSVTWHSHQDSAGNARGIELRLATDISAAAVTPHLQVTFPDAGMMIRRKQEAGCSIQVPAVSAAADEPETAES